MCHLKSLNTCKGVIEVEYLHSLKILSVKVKFWRVLAGNAVVLFNSLGVNCTRSGFKIPSKDQWLRCRPPINAHILYVCWEQRLSRSV